MRGEELEAAAPELAAFGREELEKSGVAVIGTIRRDGSPRIGLVEPCLLDGDLYLGMLWRSRKALDLLRDARIVVHNAICSSTGDERELSLRGRAIAIADPELRRRYVDAVAERAVWKEPRFHLFSVDIESAASIEYGGGEQSIKVWPQGRELRRPYG